MGSLARAGVCTGVWASGGRRTCALGALRLSLIASGCPAWEDSWSEAAEGQRLKVLTLCRGVEGQVGAS